MINKKIILLNNYNYKVFGKLDDKSYVVTTDSRKANSDSCFIALKGEVHDAFKFTDDVLENGCRLIVCQGTSEREIEIGKKQKKYPSACFIYVEDSTDYLQQLAKAHLKLWRESGNKTVLALTGSNGKTTCKEMLYFLANKIFPEKVMATQGNFNNHIGVPLTLLRLESCHSIAIIEIGTNHPGEIEALANLVNSDHAMITNIGASHLEFFDNEDNVFKEKIHLYKNLKNNDKKFAVTIIDLNDEYLKNIVPYGNPVFIGNDSGMWKYHFENDLISLSCDELIINIKNTKVREIYNKKNLLTCFLFMQSIYPRYRKKLAIIAESLVLPSNNRSQWVVKNAKHYFLDAYNANPSSVKASVLSFLDFIKQSKIDLSKCIIILGDMNELGGNSALYHHETGAFLKKQENISAVFIGKFSNDYAAGFNKLSATYKTKEMFEIDWEDLQKTYDYFLIKGSRSLQLETILDINKA